MLFRNKYRIESTRWAKWDYSAGAAYFITICTKPRRPFFGQIVKGKMLLSPCGQIVHDCWRTLPDHYKNVTLGVYAIMPDHFHGIIIIGGANQTGHPETRETTTGGELGHGVNDGKPCDGRNIVETGHAPSLQPPPTLGNIVGSFKSAVTKSIHANVMKQFGWQTRFYDRIIRDENEFCRIEQYILENPKNWK